MMKSNELIHFEDYMCDAHDYLGSDDKRSIKIGNDYYMVKLANRLEEKNTLMTSVSNNVISEYLGCHILASLGLNVQETLLGYWKDEIAVACKDFRQNGEELHEFSWYMQTVIPKYKIGRIPTYKQLYQTFNECVFLKPIRQQAIDNYWNIIIGDALIGNFDRHKDNFGYLTNKQDMTIKIAPVYDCGSCLYPSLAEDKFKDILSDDNEIKMRIYDFPKIALNKNDDKLKEDKFGYYELLASDMDKECSKALLRIYPRINLEKINKIIDETPFISEARKNFYKEMIKYRKELILDKAYEKINGKKN